MDIKLSHYQMEQCPYSEGVGCSAPDRKNCCKCGWNPKVKEQRMEQLQKGQVLQNERV